MPHISKTPWYVSGELPDLIIRAKGGTFVAGMGRANAQANANLIAASPRLLEACKFAHRIFNGHTGKPGDAITGIEFEQRAAALDSLQAAIREAVGG